MSLDYKNNRVDDFNNLIMILHVNILILFVYSVALRQQKQLSPISVGSQQSLQDSSKHSHQSNEELPMTPLHNSKMESML